MRQQGECEQGEFIGMVAIADQVERSLPGRTRTRSVTAKAEVGRDILCVVCVWGEGMSGLRRIFEAKLICCGVWVGLTAGGMAA